MSNSSLTPFTVHWHSFKTYRMTIYMEQGRYAKIVLGYTPLSSNPPKWSVENIKYIRIRKTQISHAVCGKTQSKYNMLQ